MGLLLQPPTLTLYENNIPATPSLTSFGASVSNPAAGPHVKNTTYTTLIASTAFDTYMIAVYIMTTVATGNDTSTLVDIAIGAAASETVIIPNLLGGHASTANGSFGPRPYIFPLKIPSGSRLSARVQSILTTGSANVFVELWGGPSDPYSVWAGQEVTAYGINTADSGATSVTAGNSGAEGTATSIGTTSRDHKALILGCGGVNGQTAYNALAYHFDLGIDTSSTSWLIRDYYYCQTFTNEAVGFGGKVWLPFYADVPSGTVLVVGGECSGTAQAIDFAIYGVS